MSSLEVFYFISLSRKNQVVDNKTGLKYKCTDKFILIFNDINKRWAKADVFPLNSTYSIGKTESDTIKANLEFFEKLNRILIKIEYDLIYIYKDKLGKDLHSEIHNFFMKTSVNIYEIKKLIVQKRKVIK